jgi:hypothetical protein
MGYDYVAEDYVADGYVETSDDIVAGCGYVADGYVTSGYAVPCHNGIVNGEGYWTSDSSFYVDGIKPSGNEEYLLQCCEDLRRRVAALESGDYSGGLTPADIQPLFNELNTRVIFHV